MIARFDSEERFVSRLVSGFNIFTGSGFSVEAQSIEGKGFPIGQGLLEEIKEAFPQIKKFPELSKASTVLEATCKEEFYDFLSKRFKVGNYSEEYNVLLDINIENIYTTNIDNLIYEIFKESKNKYINTTIVEGVPFFKELQLIIHPFMAVYCILKKAIFFRKQK